MSDAKLVHSTSAERTRDAKEIASLRPVLSRQPTARQPGSRSGKPESGRLCPICRESFFDFDTFARHVWDETPVYVAGLEAEVSTWREIREFRQVARMLIRVAPNSPEAVRLTGGVPIDEIRDDQCREAATTLRSCADREEVPIRTILLADEYQRRVESKRLKVLTPDEFRERAQRRERRICARAEAVLPPPAERLSRRVALGLTRAELGDQVGVKEQAVYKWETGRSIPNSPKTMRAYSQLLATANLAEVPFSDVPWSARRAKSAARRADWPPARVKALRAELGLTQPEFAQRLSYSRPTVQAWEYGTKMAPSAEGIARLNALAAELAASESVSA